MVQSMKSKARQTFGYGGKEPLDYELMYDTYMLKAVCLWRLPPGERYMGDQFPNSLEAVKNFNIAKRYIAELTKKKRPAESSAKLQNELKDLVYREMKLDIAENYEIYQALRSKSPKNKDMKYFKHFVRISADIPQNANVQSPKFAAAQQSKDGRQTVLVNERNIHMVKGAGSVRSVPELSTFYDNSETLRDKNGTDTFTGQIDNVVKIMNEQGESTHGGMSGFK